MDLLCAYVYVCVLCTRSCVHVCTSFFSVPVDGMGVGSDLHGAPAAQQDFHPH